MYNEQHLYTFETSLKNAKSQYKSFIQDTHTERHFYKLSKALRI